MTNELYHHGVLGMKWGVRRYQNKDGSLTSAGKKRYGTKSNFERVQAAKKRAKTKAKADKARAKANERTQKEIDKYNEKYLKKVGAKNKGTVEEKPRPKTISEMSNAEIQAKIDRIRLENQLRDLTPKKVSIGKRFVNDILAPVAKDVGKQYAQKAAKNLLGLNEKEVKDTSKELKKLADDYNNRVAIDKAQKHLKEGKYAESESTPEKTTVSKNDPPVVVQIRQQQSKPNISKENPAPKVKSVTINKSVSDIKPSGWDVQAHTPDHRLSGSEYASQLSKNEAEFLRMLKEEEKRRR